MFTLRTNLGMRQGFASRISRINTVVTVCMWQGMYSKRQYWALSWALLEEA